MMAGRPGGRGSGEALAEVGEVNEDAATAVARKGAADGVDGSEAIEERAVSLGVAVGAAGARWAGAMAAVVAAMVVPPGPQCADR